jgi:hypothetical protein
MDYSEILQPIEDIIKRNPLEFDHADFKLRHYLNEAWFSNTLAWLLNPNGSHGYGVTFVKEFVKAIGKKRSNNYEKFAHNESLLNWRNRGSGTGASKFSLKNASVIREFCFQRA